VNKSLLKFITDFGPLLIFFYFYKKSGNALSVAIPPLIISTIVAVFLIYVLERKIPYVPLIGAALISLFGGLTLYFDNPVFIYLKPTIINLVFAGALLVSDLFYKKNLLRLMLNNAFKLSDLGWTILNRRWAYFFIFLAILNEIVWRSFAPEKEYIWVNFKVWGILPLTFLFTAIQLPLINKYKIDEKY
tara:strand:- start:1394 stop:1960 length:567 start_codon:yes stop_codon:yes gene_type:complete